MTLQTDTGGFATIEDNGIGDASPILGFVLFNGLVGNFDVNLSFGITKPAARDPYIELFSFNAVASSFSNDGTDSMLVAFSEVGFASPGPSEFISMLTGITPSAEDGSPAGSLQLSSSRDTANQLFGVSDILFDTGILNGGVFGDEVLSPVLPAAGPYSLSLFAQIDVDGNASNFAPISTVFDYKLYGVPEPNSLLLIGGGILALVTRRRRAAN